MKVVISRLSGVSSTWWYPIFKSILLNTVLPFKSCNVSSTAGIGYITRLTATLAFLISTHKRMSPFGFSTTLMSKTHFDGPWTFSMKSHANSSSSFCFTFYRLLNGILCRFWITPGTLSSIYNLCCLVFNFQGILRKTLECLIFILMRMSLSCTVATCGPILMIPSLTESFLLSNWILLQSMTTILVVILLPLTGSLTSP